MTIDKMLKLILIVKFIQIISLNFDKPSASLFIRVDITKGKRSAVLTVNGNVVAMIALHNE